MEIQTSDFQFHNHLRACRCMQGSCRSKRGCGKTCLPSRTIAKLNKTSPNWLSFNKRTHDDTYQNLDQLIMEDRHALLNGVVFSKTDGIEAQDAHIPTALFHLERELVFAQRGLQRRQLEQVKRVATERGLAELLWETVTKECSTDTKTV